MAATRADATVGNQTDGFVSSTGIGVDWAVCLVCHAPAHSHEGACVFCRSPIDGQGDSLELLTYLARRLPGAKVGRGLLRDGPIQDVRCAVGTVEYRIRRRRGRLVLSPALPPMDWLRELMQALTTAARSDRQMRAALGRTGWAWK